MNSVIDALHFTDMTADVAFLSSGFHSLRLRKSAEHLKHYFPNSPTKTDITSRQIGWTGWPKKFAINVVIFGKFGKADGRWTADLRPMFYQMASLAEPTANLFPCCRRADGVQRKSKWGNNTAPYCRNVSAKIMCQNHTDLLFGVV